MKHSCATDAMTTAILGLLLATACSGSSDATALGDGNSLGGNTANGGSVVAPSSGGNSPRTTSGSGGSIVPGSGGNVSTGGSSSVNNATGGITAATGGREVSTVGGAPTGGTNATGGKSVSTGGAISVGGAMTGGRAASSGGAATGGAATGGKATGGLATGGAIATGGVATGGKATGGAATGGRATGGAATGGAPATGGSSNNGSLSCNTLLPASKGTKTISSSQSVSGTFDGGMVQYCGGGSLGDGGQSESQDAMFNIANGGTLKNVIIGGPGCSAADGVHCAGSCTLENVWWGDVGEDAATFRGGSTKVTIKGGGAFSASDKVFQDNTTGGSQVTITDFFVSTAGKLYRSCGTCDKADRHVVIQNVAYKNVGQLVGLNTNNGDTAKISGLLDCGGNGTICAAYKWVAKGEDPPRAGTCSY